MGLFVCSRHTFYEITIQCETCTIWMESGEKNGGNSFKLTTKNVNCNWNSNENLWKLLWTAFICVHLLKNTQFSPFTAQKCIIEIHSTKNGFLIAADKLKIRQLHGKNASTCSPTLWLFIFHLTFPEAYFNLFYRVRFQPSYSRTFYCLC